MSGFATHQPASQASPSTDPAAYAALTPSPIELFALGLVTMLELMFMFVGSGSEIINVIGPVLFSAILGISNWRLVRQVPEAIWTSIFAFRVAAIVFFGIGALVPSIITASTLDFYLGVYSFTPEEALKANVIWTLGTTMTLLGALVTNQISPLAFTKAKGVRGSSQQTFQVAMAFLAVGFGYLFAYQLATSLDLYTVSVPGTILLMLDAVNAVGVFLITMWALQRGGFAYVLLAAVLLVNVFVGLVAFNKSLAILPLMFAGLASLVLRVTVFRAMLVAFALIFSLSVLQPMVANARITHGQKYDSPNGGSLMERLAYYPAYMRGEIHPAVLQDSDTGLIRLSYVNVATAVISRYDLQQPDDSIANAGIALIPRIIWPDKPATTDSASDLSFLLSGQVGTALSPSIFPDVYWNIGWAGVLLLSPLFGIFLLFSSRVSYGILRNRDWFMMPFVLVAFRVGISGDGSMVNSIISPALMAIVIFFALRAVELIITGRRKEQRAAAA